MYFLRGRPISGDVGEKPPKTSPIYAYDPLTPTGLTPNFSRHLEVIASEVNPMFVLCLCYVCVYVCEMELTGLTPPPLSSALCSPIITPSEVMGLDYWSEGGG